MKARINQIFSSIQGEGPVVGFKQLFIRFCNCNLNCNYCDTEFTNGIEYTPQELFEKINTQHELSTFHSISLTGGEPLLSSEFLKEFLPLVKGKTKIYLETNATLFENLSSIIEYLDIISADIKLKSSTGLDTTNLHDKFFQKCKGVYTFAKIVFDENLTEEEINNCIKLGNEYNLELVLQPKMLGNKLSTTPEFCVQILEKFTKEYNNVRLIPQVHKFLEVE